MFETPASLRTARHLVPRRCCSRFAAPIHIAIALALAVAVLGSYSLTPSTSHAATASLVLPSFPGPQHGPVATSALTPRDFSYQCTVGVTTAPVVAAGVSVPAGEGISYQGCGQATVLLNSPASGHFQAGFAVSADAPAGSRAGVELLVLGPGGFNIHTAFAQAVAGTAKQADVDVSGGVALTIIPLTPTVAIMYHLKLTGQARALRTIPMAGTGMPAGATPAPKEAITTSCNAGPATDQSTVSSVTVPVVGSFRLGGCGEVTVHLPAGVGATLTVRFGTDETLTPYSAIPAQVSLSILDAGGHLLRRAIGLTYIGSGLQALWVDTRGGSTATLVDDVGPQVVATGFSFL
ncbi:MAG: hypothetical protein ACRDG4_06070, partial [Chloroflexota bacterium]